MDAPQTSPLGLILLLWAAGLGAAAQFAKVVVIFPDLQAAYPDAGAGLGFVVSLISFLGIGLGLFAGLIVTRIGFRRLLLAALALGAVVSLWQASLPALPLMLASRLVEGLSHLVIVVAAPTLIAQCAAPRHRAAAMTLWSTFFGVSFAVVAWAGLPLVARHGVGSLFLAHGGYMAVVAVLLALRLPAAAARQVEEVTLNLRRVVRMHVEIYRSPRRAAPAVGWLSYTLTYVSLLTVLPGLVAPEARALVTGVMPLAGIAVSITLGMALLRYLPAVPIVMGGFALAAAIALALLILPGSPALCIALIGALGLVQGASFAAIPQLNLTAETQAQANGAMAQMGNLGNTLGTPLLLAVTGAFGFGGLVGFVVLCYGVAISAHLAMAAARRRNGSDML